jgi:hypothetical protein
LLQHHQRRRRGRKKEEEEEGWKLDFTSGKKKLSLFFFLGYLLR